MQDWVQRLQKRDASALMAMYDRWSRPLLSLIVKITGKADQAPEMLAEVFRTFWDKSADPDFLQGSLFGTLVEMARFRALDAVGARGYRNGTQAWASFESQDRFSDPAETRAWEKLALQERSRRAIAALEVLDEGERALVEESWFEGMTCARLALRHNLPQETVRLQLVDAVRKLEATLEDSLA